MKSLLISRDYFPPQVGGISHFMDAIAAHLGPRVCCLTAVPANGRALEEGPRVYRRPSAFAGSNPVQALGWGATIAPIMLRDRPQIVQLATVGEGSLGLWLQRWLGLPFVVYAHGNEILSALRLSWPKPRLALQRADRVLANSRYTAQLVLSAGVAADRVEVVHPGCDVHRFRPLPPNADLRKKLLGDCAERRVILTVGGLVARKGHDTVIRALPRLRTRFREVAYLIVGEGPYRESLEALAASLGVRQEVVFVGRVPTEHLPDIYALSDVLVMPSREHVDSCDVEGFGLVFLEANACGKPVIGGRSGGVADAIVDHTTGLLVDPHDPDEVADALTRLLVDQHWANQMGEQGRARVIRDFGWERVGDRVEGILEAVLRERSRHR